MKSLQQSLVLLCVLLMTLYADPCVAVMPPDVAVAVAQYSSGPTTTDTSRNAVAFQNKNCKSCNKDHVLSATLDLRGGGWLIPAGWHPLGYKLTSLGEEFLAYEGSLDGDVGRFLASLKTNPNRWTFGRKTSASLKDNWVEVIRVTKSKQAMRIRRQLKQLIAFCLKAGFIE